MLVLAVRKPCIATVDLQIIIGEINNMVCPKTPVLFIFSLSSSSPLLIPIDQTKEVASPLDGPAH